MTIKAEPYAWPFDGVFDPAKTALMIIDMQVDFCGRGGYIDRLGYDITVTARAIRPIRRLLDAARQTRGLTVIHTREGHRPDLSDLPANKRWRSARFGAEIGEEGPLGRCLVRGEPGWQIIGELAPSHGELVIDKPGKSAFYMTELDLILRTNGITHLILTGITTDVCVHATMREANDRGYECLIVSDCTAATHEANHLAALKMVTMQGGVFGGVAASEDVIQALKQSIASETRGGAYDHSGSAL